MGIFLGQSALRTYGPEGNQREKWRGEDKRKKNLKFLKINVLPVADSWHLSDDHLTSAHRPRNFICCSTARIWARIWNKEGRKEMFYLTTHTTHFIYCYMASYHRITYTTAFVTPVVEHWLEWEIAQWVHHEGPYQGATSRSRIWNNNILITVKHHSVKKTWDGRKEMFYLTTYVTPFIYIHMASDTW